MRVYCICQEQSSSTSGTRGSIWNGVLLAASLELVDELDATEFHAWKLNAKEMVPTKFVEMLKLQIEN